MKKAGLIVLLVLVVFKSNGQTNRDVALAAEIKRQRTTEIPLNFPHTVERFYQGGKFMPSFMGVLNNRDVKWHAMLLIDCVLQYGLSPADYHARDLIYDKLHTLTETPDKLSDEQKARFDIMLTDAMITMINYLRYGKLNPDYGHLRLDNGVGLPFNAEKKLRNVLSQADFKAAVLTVQPRSKAYADLQYKMRQIKGLYDGDCYSVPEETVRKVAINMERLRWAEMDDNAAYVHVNIPSFTLNYHSPQTDKEFRVIVGTAANPTPVLQSEIEYFNTEPQWKTPGCDNALGLLVFRFPNIYSVYMHDTPDKFLFNRKRRDLSHSCIRVENADELAALLLRNDRQEKEIASLTRSIAKPKRRNFALTKPVPFKITYLTCLMVDGELVNYDDVYWLDQALEMALYNLSDTLVSK